MSEDALFLIGAAVGAAISLVSILVGQYLTERREER